MIMKRILKGIVRGYQLFISPVFPSNCRFYPTCSHYSMEALEKHGAIKGLWLSLRRIGRCHPWNEGGVDLVPEPQSKPGRDEKIREKKDNDQ
jgi:hypothetical protein